MAEAKTKPTIVSARSFIAGVENETRRRDAETLLNLFENATGWKAKMWGASIIGFGRYDYTYESGRSGIAPVVGFSPRKANMVAYIMDGFDGYDAELAKLGKCKTGKSCLYLSSLEGTDLKVLERMIKASVSAMKKKWPVSAN